MKNHLGILGMICIFLRKWFDVGEEFSVSGNSSFTNNDVMPVVVPDQKEFMYLQKALKEAKIKSHILKKALSIFSKSDNKYSV